MKVQSKEKTIKNTVIKLTDREASLLLSILVDTNEADMNHDFLAQDAYPFLVRLMDALRDR